MNTIIGYIVIFLIAAGLISTVISLYNRLIMLKFNVDKAYANIDLLLKQRTDEIPDLIKVVKESVNYESSQLEKLTKLRTAFINSTDQDERVKLSNTMAPMVHSLVAVAENYPDLKANTGFNVLQQRVSDIEDAITDRRELFNESVNMYNIGIHEFPNVLLARILGYKDKTLLRVSEQEKQYDGIRF
ncbi:LemA family protein [Sinomicrobium sp.]